MSLLLLFGGTVAEAVYPIQASFNDVLPRLPGVFQYQAMADPFTEVTRGSGSTVSNVVVFGSKKIQYQVVSAPPIYELLKLSPVIVNQTVSIYVEQLVQFQTKADPIAFNYTLTGSSIDQSMIYSVYRLQYQGLARPNFPLAVQEVVTIDKYFYQALEQYLEITDIVSY